MKKLVTLLIAAAFAAAGGLALAQSTDTPKSDADKAKMTGKDAMESQMNLQKNKPSRTPTEAEKAMPKNKPTGKEAMQSQMDLQKNKPAKKVKNENVPPPPNVSKMTPEERAKLRKEVVEGAKP
jgi:hypothetical protein